jgi:hypothetical protein
MLECIITQTKDIEPVVYEWGAVKWVANNDVAPGCEQSFDLEDSVRIMDVRIAHRHAGQTARPRSGRQQDSLRFVRLAMTVRKLDLDPAPGKEPRSAAHFFDPVSTEVALDRLGHEVRDVEPAGHQQRPRILIAAVHLRERLLADAAQIDRALAQSLGGDACFGDRDAAGAHTSIDDRDALVEVCGLGGALLARGSRADDDEIDLLHQG